MFQSDMEAGHGARGEKVEEKAKKEKKCTINQNLVMRMRMMMKMM
jgi:hypothetical protein